MLPGKTFTSEDAVRIALRRRWLILLPLAMGLALVPAIARFVPEVYRSETMIMVIPQRVPDTYVKSTVTGSVEDRLPSISDQILSRSRLERVITDFDLYPQQRAVSPMEDIVQRMRTDVGPVSIVKGAQSFRVGYTSPNASTAQKVAARLASLFIDENSRDRESLANNTNVFLESQLEEAKRGLVEHEQKLEAYRRAHAGELPTQLQSNLQAIQNAQLQLQSVSESLNRASERRLLIERQLADARAIPADIAPPPLTSGRPEATALLPVAQRLELAKANLQALKLKYKPEHPDVRALERTIQELQQAAAEDAARPAADAPQPVSVEEQARQKRIRALEADLDVVAHQLSVGQAEEVRLKALMADYGRKVDAVPTRESELVSLTRDYETLKKGYDTLLTKNQDSKLAADLERRQIGEQFRVLDPASLPERPANELKRMGVSFAGAIVGLFLGLAGAVLLELRDSSFSKGEDVARVLTVPVLALVPLMTTDRETRRTRYRRLAMDVAGSVAMVASVAVVVVWGLSQR